MITILKSEIKKVKYIIHVGDIHCRLNQRVIEYKEVFDKFFDMIKDLPKDETIIVNVGDTFHNKNELQPEGIQLVKNFFIGCSDLFPTIVIGGNHDAILSNKSRLDSISPIVEMLNRDNLFYLKDSGLYGYSDILFNNMSIFDEPDKYIRGESIPSIYKNKYSKIIGLFHGPIDQAVSDTGHVIKNPAIMTPLFDNHHIILCGDIHKLQDIQPYDPDYNKPIIHYCGSLIQQNNGELLRGHGYSLWNLDTDGYTHYDVPNNYGFFTIEIENGNLVTDISGMPLNVRLRVLCKNSIPSEIKSIISKIKNKHNVIESSFIRSNSKDEKENASKADINLKNILNIDYQNELISKYILELFPAITQSSLEGILNLNRKINSEIQHSDYNKNLKYKLIKFEWDNMFTYGENNYIDFTNMKNVYGVFGKNRCGKSSILSAILFCLFDKFDRGTKGNLVLNSQKTSFKCQLELEIDNVRYFIKREGTISRTGAVKVDVRFWKNVNGEEIELHGTERSDTNDIIRNYVGTYDDFILTTAAFQCGKNNLSFIDMGHSDRKDILVKFIGINVFDSLYECGNEKKKEIAAELKIHKGKDYQTELLTSENALTYATTLYEEESKEIEKLKSETLEVGKKIEIETLKLIKLDLNIPINISELRGKKSTLEGKIDILKIHIQSLEDKSRKYQRYIGMIDSRIARVESLNLLDNHKKYRLLAEKIANAKKKIDIKKVEIRGKLDKSNRLKTHKYDPNCKFCIDNDFVRDANTAKSELVKDKTITRTMVEELETLETQFEEVKWVDSKYDLYSRLLHKKGELKDQSQQVSESVLTSNNNLLKGKEMMADLDYKISIYNQNQVAIDTNQSINTALSVLKLEQSNIEINHQKHTNRLTELYGKIEVLKNNIIKLKATIEELKSKEIEFDQYDKYLTSIGRDGIPYKIILDAVPTIEKEVNYILTQIADYTIKFETDGQNIIPYIVYEHGKWPVEIASGYERFAISLAIRVALIEVSNLPKSGGVFIDEGFGVLDSSNITSMITFFSILKAKFDFIFVISHLDQIKDMADHIIEIKNTTGQSLVQYS